VSERERHRRRSSVSFYLFIFLRFSVLCAHKRVGNIILKCPSYMNNNNIAISGRFTVRNFHIIILLLLLSSLWFIIIVFRYRKNTFFYFLITVYVPPSRPYHVPPVDDRRVASWGDNRLLPSADPPAK